MSKRRPTYSMFSPSKTPRQARSGKTGTQTSTAWATPQLLSTKTLAACMTGLLLPRRRSRVRHQQL